MAERPTTIVEAKAAIGRSQDYNRFLRGTFDGGPGSLVELPAEQRARRQEVVTQRHEERVASTRENFQHWLDTFRTFLEKNPDIERIDLLDAKLTARAMGRGSSTEDYNVSYSLLRGRYTPEELRALGLQNIFTDATLARDQGLFWEEVRRIYPEIRVRWPDPGNEPGTVIEVPTSEPVNVNIHRDEAPREWVDYIDAWHQDERFQQRQAAYEEIRSRYPESTEQNLLRISDEIQAWDLAQSVDPEHNIFANPPEVLEAIRREQSEPSRRARVQEQASQIHGRIDAERGIQSGFDALGHGVREPVTFPQTAPPVGLPESAEVASAGTFATAASALGASAPEAARRSELLTPIDVHLPPEELTAGIAERLAALGTGGGEIVFSGLPTGRAARREQQVAREAVLTALATQLGVDPHALDRGRLLRGELKLVVPARPEVVPAATSGEPGAGAGAGTEGAVEARRAEGIIRAETPQEQELEAALTPEIREARNRFDIILRWLEAQNIADPEERREAFLAKFWGAHNNQRGAIGRRIEYLLYSPRQVDQILRIVGDNDQQRATAFRHTFYTDIRQLQTGQISFDPQPKLEAARKLFMQIWDSDEGYQGWLEEERQAYEKAMYKHTPEGVKANFSQWVESASLIPTHDEEGYRVSRDERYGQLYVSLMKSHYGQNMVIGPMANQLPESLALEFQNMKTVAYSPDELSQFCTRLGVRIEDLQTIRSLLYDYYYDNPDLTPPSWQESPGFQSYVLRREGAAPTVQDHAWAQARLRGMPMPRFRTVGDIEARREVSLQAGSGQERALDRVVLPTVVTDGSVSLSDALVPRQGIDRRVDLGSREAQVGGRPILVDGQPFQSRERGGSEPIVLEPPVSGSVVTLDAAINQVRQPEALPSPVVITPLNAGQLSRQELATEIGARVDQGAREVVIEGIADLRAASSNAEVRRIIGIITRKLGIKASELPRRDFDRINGVLTIALPQTTQPEVSLQTPVVGQLEAKAIDRRETLSDARDYIEGLNRTNLDTDQIRILTGMLSDSLIRDSKEAIPNLTIDQLNELLASIRDESLRRKIEWNVFDSVRFLKKIGRLNEGNAIVLAETPQYQQWERDHSLRGRVAKAISPITQAAGYVWRRGKPEPTPEERELARLRGTNDVGTLIDILNEGPLEPDLGGYVFDLVHRIAGLRGRGTVEPGQFDLLLSQIQNTEARGLVEAELTTEITRGSESDPWYAEARAWLGRHSLEKISESFANIRLDAAHPDRILGLFDSVTQAKESVGDLSENERNNLGTVIATQLSQKLREGDLGSTKLLANMVFALKLEDSIDTETREIIDDVRSLAVEIDESSQNNLGTEIAREVASALRIDVRRAVQLANLIHDLGLEDSIDTETREIIDDVRSL